MAYEIQATLAADGTPRLRVIDTTTGQPRIDWDASAGKGPVLKSLFHDLLLLSAVERIAGLSTKAAVRVHASSRYA